MKNIFKNKKLKYGSLGAGLTVAVIALIVIVNIIISALAGNFSWYFDMTSEKYYDISDTTRGYIDAIDPELNDITIYFLAPADQLSQAASATNYAQSTSLWGMKYIYSLATELADEYSFIKVDHIDLTGEPDRLREIVGDDYFDAMSFSRNQVIVDNYTVEREQDGAVINGVDGKPLYRHNFRIYARNAFYCFDYTSSGYNTVTAFKGDYRFCSAIMSVCEKTIPTLYLISGHGEKIGSYTIGTQNADYNYAQYLCQLFIDSGFNIKKIDLQHENFGDEPNAVAVIFSPQTDYSRNASLESHNELGKLDEFLSRDNHSLMVFLDYGTQALPTLEGYLEENFDMTVENAKLKDNGENSIDVNMQDIVGEPSLLKNEGGLIASRLVDISGESKAIFPAARPVTIKEGSGKTSAIYFAPSSASAVYAEQKINYGAEEAALAAISSLDHGSYVFCTGSSETADVYFSDSALYNNRDMFLSVIEKMSTEAVPVGVQFKIITSEGLDLTKHQATLDMILICAVIPLAVLAVGTVVYIRRRHS